MGIITDILITILLLLYHLVGQNVVLAIIAFTVIVRLAILPLTLKQQRSMKRMQELSPKLKQLQAKYKDDRERLVQEQMALYKEHGVNPFAGCLPLLIQLPILFGLWRAIIATLASSPSQLLALQDRILIGGLDHLVPLHNTFLWLNLALPDPYYILPALVVVTTYVQQKLIMPPPSPSAGKRKPGSRPPDPAEQAEQMTRTMTTLMPLMFGFFALSYSSGLSIYIITANIIGVIQYAALGKVDFRRLIGRESPATTVQVEPEQIEAVPARVSENGKEKENGKGESVEEAVVAEAITTSRRRLKPGFTEKRLRSTPPAAVTKQTAEAKPRGRSSARGPVRSKSKTKSRSKR
jgi:YidC/Oxa1 family membrane protein insertase